MCHSTDYEHLQPEAPPPWADRFWRYVSKGKGCWVWTGNRAGGPYGGYGQFEIAGRNYRAHRLAWSMANGPIPEDRFILHRCDNPPCVNPDHLYAGTPADNNADMVRRGRAHGTSSPGESNPFAKLTEAQVRAIRAAHAAGETGVSLGRRFGTAQTNISAIVNRLAWRHVS